jgi:hypothetical protein
MLTVRDERFRKTLSYLLKQSFGASPFVNSNTLHQYVITLLKFHIYGIVCFM